MRRRTGMGESTTSARASLSGIVLILCAAAFGARGDPAHDAELAARRAFEDLQHGADPAVHLPLLLQALSNAGLPSSATVSLSVLSQSQDPRLVAAARAELTRRAEADSALALPLLSRRAEVEQGVPPEVLVNLARSHLDRALALAPPEEGASFASAGAVPVSPGAVPVSAGAAPVSPGAAPVSPGAVPAEGPAAVGQPPGATDAGLPQSGPAAAGPPASADGGAPARAVLDAPVTLPAAVAELSRARVLAAQVPESSPAAAEAHEVAGLAALGVGDFTAAEREFAILAWRDSGRSGRERRKADPADVERKERAILQLARLAYARGDDAAAEALYARVSRSAPEWLDALFESSWAHFRRGADEKALGNLLTLHAPFFQGRYFPESFVLKALLLYENCRYTDASRTLAQFEARYGPVNAALSALLSQVTTPQLGAELLEAGAQGIAQRVAEPARAEVSRLLLAPQLVAQGRAASELAAELDSFDGRSPQFRSSALARALLPELRAARLSMLDGAGRRVRARLVSARGELRELLGQSLRLSYEIAGREMELAREGAAGVARTPRAPRSLPQVDDDEELWPFQGEYWRDELGSYQFTLGEHCRRAAPGVPAQSASLPAPADDGAPDAAPAPAPVRP